MANTLLSYGKFEKVSIDVAAAETVIGGLDSFEIGIDDRDIVDVPRTFDDGRKEQIVGEKNTQTWSMSGFYLTGADDDGWNELQTKYDNAEVDAGQIAAGEIKFYTDNGQNGTSQYLTPTAGSFIIVTSIGPISATREGWTTFAASGILVGELEELTA